MSTPDSSPEQTRRSISCSDELPEKPKPGNGAFVSSAKFVLRPSALSAQAEKLKLLKPEEKCPNVGNSNSNSSSTNQIDCDIDVCKTPDDATKKTVDEREPTTSVCNLFARDDTPSFRTILTASPAIRLVAPKADNPRRFVSTSADDDSSDGDGFVFGCNLHQRAANYNSMGCKNQPSEQQAYRNLTFQAAAELKSEANFSNNKQENKSLSDSAKAYQVKRERTKYSEVSVCTGEEHEANVIQISCKLFAFDKTKMSWQERGRGCLRLNDREDEGVLHSRLIMRVQGSLQLILNTKVWSAMKLERPSIKTVQLTAMDSEGLKVYLIMANPNDSEQLFNALECRITNLKHQEMLSNNASEAVVSSTTRSAFVPIDTSSNDSFESSPRKRFRPIHAEDGSADSSTENITTEGTYDASSENSTDSTDGIKPFNISCENENGEKVD